MDLADGREAGSGRGRPGPRWGVRLATERARRCLEEYFGGRSLQGNGLPEALRCWIRQQETLFSSADDAPPPRRPLVVEAEGKRLVVRLLSEPSETVLFMEEHRTALDPSALEPLGLTRRQAEVLAWVAEGKTNEEVAAILGTRRRTIEKHLERIYQKLGVETRAAAIRLALVTSQTAST